MASLAMAIAMAVLAHHDPASSSIVDPTEVQSFCLMVTPTGAVNWGQASIEWTDRFRAAVDLMELIGGKEPVVGQAELVAWCMSFKPKLANGQKATKAKAP